MKKIAVVALVFLAALSSLIWVSLASAIPVLSLAKLGTPEYPGGNVEIKDAKVAKVESWSPLRFSVTRRQDSTGHVVWVETPRSIPENFKEGIDIGLQGSYDAKTNTFLAYRLTTACPSKYEASKDTYGAAGAAGAAGAGVQKPVLPGEAPAANAKGVN